MASPPDYYISSDYDDSSYGQAEQQPPLLSNKNILVAAIVVLFCVLFFFSTLHIYGEWLWRSHNRNSNKRQFQSANQSQASPAMRIAGLSKAAIALLPTFTYSVAESDASEKDAPSLLECAVCLSEFQENDKGRMLPACKHSFHMECIDMWFYSHSTCPLCRTRVQVMPTTLIHWQQQIRAGEEEDQAAPHEIQISIDTTISSTSSSTHDINDAPAAATIAISSDLTNATEISPDAHLLCRNSSTSHMPALSQWGATHNSEKPSPSSSNKHTRRRVPHITIEIPTRQDIQNTSPRCVSLPSRRLRFLVSPHEQSCSSHASLKSPCSTRVPLRGY